VKEWVQQSSARAESYLPQRSDASQIIHSATPEPQKIKLPNDNSATDDFCGNKSVTDVDMLFFPIRELECNSPSHYVHQTEQNIGISEDNCQSIDNVNNVFEEKHPPDTANDTIENCLPTDYVDMLENEQASDSTDTTSYVSDDVDMHQEPVSVTSFDRVDDNPVEYRYPSEPRPTVGSCRPQILQSLFYRLHLIFTIFGVVLRAQNAILRFIRDLPPELKEKLPLDGRTLRPPKIKHTISDLHPGEFVYFGIENVLSFGGATLFDPKAPEIRLSVNIDGLPLYRNAKGKGLWPLLGCIDDHPVWVIGFYHGIKKPVCPNQFLKDFVLEVKELQMHGLTIDNVVYRFKLQKMLMDTPARAYIVGVKSHNAIHGCSKCTACGVSFELPGVNKVGGKKKSTRYLDMNALPRTNADFGEHYHNFLDPHGTVIVDADEDMLNQDDGDIQLHLDAHKRKLPKKSIQFHQHPCILSTILGFDLVKDVPLDYMHLVCIGVMKRLLGLWVLPGTAYKMTKEKVENASKRLLAVREYFPKEFQRKSESFECLAAWKATQYRSFLLYIGVVILRDILSTDLLEHFQLLVVCMRILARHVSPDSPERLQILQRRGNIARKWLRSFVKRGVHLYTENFAVYNVHNLIHCADDYIRFGALDSYSCFRYESCLGRLKKLVTGHCKPAIQIINKFSTLLLFKEYGKEGNRGTNFDEEYFEVPKLYYGIIDEDNDGIATVLNKKYERFERMRFKNFIIRSDRTADSFCFLSDGKFLKVEKILRDRKTKEIRIVGQIFENIRPLFDLRPEGGCSSEDVGMVIGSNLSSKGSYYFGDIDCKCFAMPFQLDNTTENGEWTLVKFLH